MIDVSPYQLEVIKVILKKHVPDCEVRAFGSRVTWTAKDYSDLDLAVVGNEKLPTKTIFSIKEAFQESDLPFRVDVLDWNAISKEFQKVIKRKFEIIQKAGDQVSNGWHTYKLNEVMDIVGGGTPKTTVKEYWGGDIPWLSVVDFGGGNRWVNKTEKTITQKGLKESSTKVLKRGQLIISARGTVGEIAQLGQDMAFNQSCYGLDAKSSIVSNDFLYYLLKYKVDSLKRNTHGAVFDTITRQTFEHIEVKLPPLPEQKAIAKILGDLDEKIELNQQMNKTLEAMAQALFKQWFVEFEFPGHEKVKFVNGLPEGWREGRLIEICDIIMGQSPPGKTYNESGNGIAFYQGNRDFGFRFPLPRVYCTAPTRIAEAGDVLISVRAPVGALNITLTKCAIGRGVAALRMKRYSNGFLFYFLSTRKDLWDQFNSEGTVFGCLNKTEFHKVAIDIPADSILSKFDAIIKPIDIMIQNNEIENRSLREARDSLLPKLMSGKIKVNG